MTEPFKIPSTTEVTAARTRIAATAAEVRDHMQSGPAKRKLAGWELEVDLVDWTYDLEHGAKQSEEKINRARSPTGPRSKRTSPARRSGSSRRSPTLSARTTSRKRVWRANSPSWSRR